MLLISNMYPSENNEFFGTFVKNFNDGMSSLGYDITKRVITKSPYSSKNKISVLKRYFIFYISTWIELMKNKNDLTYVHYVSHCALPVLLSRKQNILISNVHGTDILPKTKKQKFFNKFVFKLLKKSTLIVVPSNYYKEVVENKYLIDSNKIFVSPSGGINTDMFKQKQEPNKNNTPPVFGFVSRIESGKGWDIFIKAINELKNENFKFILIGSGSKEEEMKKLIRDYSLENRITVLPSQPHRKLVEYFNSITCLVFPSEFESLGLVGLESMACGTPVIGAANQGILTYLKDYENGLVFKNGDYENLAEKIKEFSLLSDNEYTNLSLNSVKTAKKYNQELISKNLDTIIKMLINRNRK